MAKSARSLLKDPRYRDFCLRYRNDLHRYVVENSRHQVTWQQADLYRAIQEPGCRVACASGHGCFGKGTPMLLASGHILPVEDVVVGDI